MEEKPQILHEKATITPLPVSIEMVAVLMEQPHFEVPARMRDERSPADGHEARLLLADRIAGLPYIRTVDNEPEALPSSVTVYLSNEQGPARKRTPPVTLCVIRRDGLTIHGLGPEDRRHLLARGWGTVNRDRLQLFLPRDEQEVDVCWTILQYAHFALLNPSASSPGVRHAAYGSLPKFSRTTLQ